MYLDARQGNCYTSVTRTGQCKNRLPIKLSKKDCCCGMNMGKGWGDNCDICPTPDTGKINAMWFRSLCRDYKWSLRHLCSFMCTDVVYCVTVINFT